METKEEPTPKNRKGIIGWVTTILIGIILFATNPTEEQFKEYLKEDLKKQAYKDGEISGAVMEVFARPTAWIMGLTTEKKDFYLFSIYGVTVFDEKIGYIGVLNHFIRIN